MNQEIHDFIKPFMTVGAIFVDDFDIGGFLYGVDDDDDDSLDYQGHCYTFKAEIDSGIQVGDFVLAHVGDELKIVKIVQVHSTPQINPKANFEYKWIVQKIDIRDFRARQYEEYRINKLLNILHRVGRKNSLAATVIKQAFKRIMRRRQQNQTSF